jgi:cell division protein FtsZ
MAKSNFVPNPAKIKVIGVGGGGCNAITRMVRGGQIEGVDFIGINTDAQALLLTEAPTRIQIGDKLTKGLGVGGDPRAGSKAAEESRDELHEVVMGADMVFITTGEGGGTGTGASPIVAELAKETGALTIAIVTKPFSFEGAPRMRSAEDGLEKLMDKVDTLITIPNDRLLGLCDHKVLMQDAFKLADQALEHGVAAIANVITIPGMVNLDFADIKTVMKDAGQAWMSIGLGSGPNRASDAAKAAIASPLLDVSIEGAKGVLFNVNGGESLTLHEVNEAAEVIRKAVDADANIIFGVVFNSKMNDEVQITLIATGFAPKLKGIKPKEEELRKLLKDLRNKDETELDVPAFMRQPAALQRRQSIIRPAGITNTSDVSVRVD